MFKINRDNNKIDIIGKVLLTINNRYIFQFGNKKEILTFIWKENNTLIFKDNFNKKYEYTLKKLEDMALMSNCDVDFGEIEK